MHAIIMGAGEGTRMWPISTMVNKHLLKLGGKPVIRIIAERIRDSNKLLNHDITIVCLEKDLKDYQWEFRDSEVKFFPIEYNTGTAHEFYNAFLNLPAKENDILLHYGDTITDLDYGKMIDDWDNSKSQAAMIAITKNIKHDYSEVHTGSQGMVYKIVEKPNLTTPSWTGIGIFNASYFIQVYNSIDVPKEVYLDFGFHVLPAMAQTHKLWGWEYDGRWFDVGNLRSYQKLAKEYQSKDLNL